MTTPPDRAEAQLPGEVATALDRGVATVQPPAAQLQAAAAEFEAQHLGPLLDLLGMTDRGGIVRAYAHDWALWASWCAAEGRQPLPARGIDVAVYLAACARTTTYALKTLIRRRDAISAVHRAQGHPSPTADPIVGHTIQVLRRTHERPPRAAQALTVDHIARIIDHLPPPGWPSGLRRRYDRCLLLMGHRGGLSVSELATRTLDDVEVLRDPATGATTLLVHLGTKADATGVYEEAAVLTRSDHRPTCPVCAFVDWVELREVHIDGGKDEVRRFLEADTDATNPAHVCDHYTGTPLADGTRRPLFPTTHRGSHIGANPIGAQTVNNIVKRYVERIGLDPNQFAGQSLRAGSTTALAMGDSLMRQGGWATRVPGARVRRLVSPGKADGGSAQGK